MVMTLSIRMDNRDFVEKFITFFNCGAHTSYVFTIFHLVKPVFHGCSVYRTPLVRENSCVLFKGISHVLSMREELL